MRRHLGVAARSERALSEAADGGTGAARKGGAAERQLRAAALRPAARVRTVHRVQLVV